MTPLAELGRAMFAAAVAAVRPEALVRRVEFTARGVRFGDAELEPAGRLAVVAIGKAAPELAGSFLRQARRPPDDLFVLAPDGVHAPSAVAEAVRRASHPLPDERGERATLDLLLRLSRLAPDDGVVVLLSGGGSALLAAPLAGVTRELVTAVTRAVMAAGGTIHELNAVRKHLLAAAGGRLAAACPAAMLTLAVSDVPGDALPTIASGPTVGDPTTFADAGAVLRRHGLGDRFPDVLERFARGARGELAESPKPGSTALARSTVRLLGGNGEALRAAAAVAARAGFRAVEVTRTLRGEAREVGRALSSLGLAVGAGEPSALLLAGETTVTVHGSGRGGRNLELALAAAIALAGESERCVLSGGSDGIDGSSPAAGAVVDGVTVERGARLGRDAQRHLDNNDSWGFFEGLEEAIVTGPTGTNVADLAFVLVQGRPVATAARPSTRPAAGYGAS